MFRNRPIEFLVWACLVLISIDQGWGGWRLIGLVICGLWWMRLRVDQYIRIVIGAYIGVFSAHLLGWEEGVAYWSLVVWRGWVVTVISWVARERQGELGQRLPLSARLVNNAEQGRAWIIDQVTGLIAPRDFYRFAPVVCVVLGMLFAVWGLIDLYNTWLTRELVPTILTPRLIVAVAWEMRARFIALG